MAEFIVTDPSGKEHVVTAPEGATQDQVLEYARTQLGAQPPKKEKSLTEALLTPVASLAGGVNRGTLTGLAGIPANAIADVLNLGIAGYGMGARALGRPASELPDTLDRRSLPLTSEWLQSKIGATKVGETLFQPQAAQEFPRVNAFGQGVGMSPGGLRNAIVGGTSALVSREAQTQAAKVPQLAPYQKELGILAAVSTPAAFGAGRIEKPISEKEKILRESQDAGYIVAPSQADKQSVLQGMSGKLQTAQMFSDRNQKTTNRLAAEDVGLGPKEPMTAQRLDQVIRDKGTVYARVSKEGGTINPGDDLQLLQDSLDLSKSADKVRSQFKLAELPAQDKIGKLAESVYNGGEPFTVSAALEYAKKLRFQAKSNLSSSENPDALALGMAQKDAANALESSIERNLAAQGKADLMTEFTNARVTIAKAHMYKDALSPAGNVNAATIAKEPYVTGNSKLISDFAKTFPKAVQSMEKTGGYVPFSPFDLWAGATGAGAAAAFQNPKLLAIGAAVPMARLAAREALATPLAQNMLRTPSPVTPTTSPMIPRNGMLNYDPSQLGVLPLTMPGLLQNERP